MLFQKIRWNLLAFLAIVLVATSGYRYIEHWSWLDSFWMVVITMTTIGYGEAHPLSETGKLFTLVLIIGGVAFGTYTIGRLTQHVIDGGLARDITQAKKRRIMRKLKDHFIVVGHGRIGREVAAEIVHAGREVVVVEVNGELLAGHGEFALSITGDASHDKVLADAGITHAGGIAVATGSSATNVFITLSARQLNPRLHIITRVEDEETARKALRAGANAVINPNGIGGARIAQGLLRPHAAAFVDLAIGSRFGEFALDDVRIGDVPEYNGPLAKLSLPERHKVTVIAVRRSDGQIVIAEKGTVLSPGDVAVVMGRPSELLAFAAAASGSDRSR